MKVLIQRVSQASVSVDSEIIGKIAQGLLLYCAIAVDDEPANLSAMANKIANLRVFSDKDGKFNILCWI
jgi:D-tyrosyl-tRNA(Tyr) deacylase